MLSARHLAHLSFINCMTLIAKPLPSGSVWDTPFIYCVHSLSPAYPKEIVQPLILAAIDQAWAVYLLEIEDARDRIGVVSLTGRNYEVEYTKEVAGMFEAMLSDIEETIEATLARLEGKTLHVERL